MTAPFSAYAAEIYLRGLGDELPRFPTDPSALEEAARATLTDENTLEARGYLGISLLGRSQTWQRVDRDAPNLETDLLK